MLPCAQISEDDVGSDWEARHLESCSDYLGHWTNFTFTVDWFSKMKPWHNSRTIHAPLSSTSFFVISFSARFSPPSLSPSPLSGWPSAPFPVSSTKMQEATQSTTRPSPWSRPSASPGSPSSTSSGWPGPPRSGLSSRTGWTWWTCWQ